MLMKEYIIKITGEYKMLVLSPQMISLLIEKIEMSDSKELVIPAEEILPQGYIEYLALVLSTNFEIDQSKTVIQAAYDMIAEQIDKLRIDTQKCFDDVSFSEKKQDGRFDLNTNEKFYMLIKQKNSIFLYSYSGLDGKNIKVTLIYQ